jgi:acetyl-CoA carboxylase biotin carboxyl carrier protein
MSDQETPHAPGEEQYQQKAKQPERGGGGAGGGRERSRRRHHQQQQQQSQPRRPEASLNMEELRELVELIAEHGFTEFELEREGFRVRLGRDLSSQQPPMASAVSPVMQTPTQATRQTPATTASASQSAGSAAAQGSGTATPPADTSEEGAPAAAATTPSEDEGLHIINSPIVGTFYRSPSPTAEPFVRLGSHINADTVVCIIEAMKLMNEIQAETSGEVVKIYVENGQPVEYGQPLFGIKK